MRVIRVDDDYMVVVALDRVTGYKNKKIKKSGEFFYTYSQQVHININCVKGNPPSHFRLTLAVCVCAFIIWEVIILPHTLLLLLSDRALLYKPSGTRIVTEREDGGCATHKVHLHLWDHTRLRIIFFSFTFLLD